MISLQLIKINGKKELRQIITYGTDFIKNI